MDLTTALSAWDGKTTAELERIAATLDSSGYSALLEACGSDDAITARAASWILKALYTSGADIPFPAKLLAQDLHWETALHLLQSIQYVTVDIPAALVAPYLTHPKPMLRAWGLDAYIRLGPPDGPDVLKRAACDKAASVRARARNIEKERAQPVPKLRPT